MQITICMKCQTCFLVEIRKNIYIFFNICRLLKILPSMLGVKYHENIPI